MIYDVIVIGAGISGLAAAQKLKAAGFNILILEARDRIGGRIHTDHRLGFPLDLGASWTHDVERNPLAQEAERLGLKLFPFTRWLEYAHDHVCYDAENLKLDRQRLEKLERAVEGIFEELLTKATDESVPFLIQNFAAPDLSTQELNIIKKWLNHILCCWSGTELDKTSVELWKDVDENVKHSYVLNGYDTLIKFFAKGLNVVLHSEVTGIVYTEGLIEVKTSHAIYVAKKVIVTIPIGVLQSGKIQFSPALPAAKVKAIQAIGVGVLDKAVLCFPHCFWEEDALTIQRFPTQESEIPAYVNYYALLRKPVLVAFSGGELAKQVEQMSATEQEKAFLAPLRKIYGNRYVEPQSMLLTRWYHDPYALGAYSYLARGETAACFDALAKSVNNRLFFAGEATDNKRYASVHGAYLSGLRAADEILSH